MSRVEYESLRLAACNVGKLKYDDTTYSKFKSLVHIASFMRDAEKFQSTWEVNIHQAQKLLPQPLHTEMYTALVVLNRTGMSIRPYFSIIRELLYIASEFSEQTRFISIMSDPLGIVFTAFTASQQKFTKISEQALSDASTRVISISLNSARQKVPVEMIPLLGIALTEELCLGSCNPYSRPQEPTKEICIIKRDHEFIYHTKCFYGIKPIIGTKKFNSYRRVNLVRKFPEVEEAYKFCKYFTPCPSRKHPVLLNTFQHYARTLLDHHNRCWTISHQMLGRSMSSSVFRGICPDGSLVAIKTVHDRSHKCNTSDSIQRIIDETYTLRELNHPHIVKYIASFTLPKQVALITEFVPCGTLHQVIRNFSPLDISLARRYLFECFTALKYIQGKGIVHGDITPHNIMIDLGGSCKLCDFGSSFQVDRKSLHQRSFGTPLFMAPEACRGQPCIQSDIWSMGIIAYNLLTGMFPFDASSMDASNEHSFVHQMGAFNLTDKSMQICDVDPVIWQFLSRLLQFDPLDRPCASEVLRHSFFDETLSKA